VVNAGHMPPLVRRADGQVEELGASIAGVPMGVDSSFAYEQLSADMTPGDLVVMFTDGISEAMNARDDLFGESRLGRLVETHAHLPSEELRERVLRDIAAFVGDAPQHDDMTMILLKIDELPVVSTAIDAELAELAE